VLTLKLNFYTPFAREFVLAAGMCDVSATSCHYNLSRGPGSSILIVIGGAQEVSAVLSLIAPHRSDEITLPIPTTPRTLTGAGRTPWHQQPHTQES
jgi:hypothetical protein